MATRTQRLMIRGAHLVWRITRGMTLGVRAAVIDAQDRVCLIRHTYMEGWHLPGGGVETGETALDALVRECREEAEIEVDPGAARLHGVYFNTAVSRRDHVVLYVVRRFTVRAAKAADREIVEAGFFPLTALPADTSPATRARLAEITDGLPPATRW
ncbi:NUDIX domain-containing protein [Methylobacterium sp. ID0610]|uniref:NUDIX domain-containing protein n=1 Tax=Methylobacterium carpenticola TaxID=3344827 RepID=UPI0036A47DE0